MNQEIKDEASEQIEKDVLFGFENEEELFDSILDMFYDEEDFDEKWLAKEIKTKFQLHEEESKTWSRPTDFDKLAEAFDKLIQQKIICLHKAGYTKQDGYEDVSEAKSELEEKGILPIGFCFYHTQDLERAVDPKMKNLFLAFDSMDQNKEQAINVGKKIVEVLTQSGFQTNWNGTLEQRIEIKNIDWKKLPDGQDWGIDRAVSLMRK